MSFATGTTLMEESAAFYHAIGEAVTRWADVETGLYWIASQCLPTADEDALERAFYSIENFRSKHAFVDRAIRTAKFRHLSVARRKEGLADWGEVSATVQALSFERNKIIHGHLLVHLSARPGRRFALVPRHPRPPKRKQAVPTPPPDAYCVSQIDLARQKFGEAQMRLLFLHDLLGGRERPFAARARLEPKSRSLAQLARQMRTALLQRG